MRADYDVQTNAIPARKELAPIKMTNQQQDRAMPVRTMATG